jgi:hypothetical protein
MYLCFQATNALKKDGERQTKELEELRTANKSLQDQMSRLKQAVSPVHTKFLAHSVVIGITGGSPITDVIILMGLSFYLILQGCITDFSCFFFIEKSAVYIPVCSHDAVPLNLLKFAFSFLFWFL